MRNSAADDLSRHLSRNEKLVAKIRELGGDLHDGRAVDFFFYASCEHDAEEIAGELRDLGFVNVQVGERKDKWAITAEKHASVAAITETAFVAQLIALVSRYTEAEFDGWGTAI